MKEYQPKDNVTTIDELKAMVKEFCAERDWDQFHSPKDLAIGMSTESNELLDLFRFKTPEEILELMNDEVKGHERVCEELADTFYFVLRFAQKYDYDLTGCLIDKLAKNDAKYPVEKAKGKNLKYDEL